MTGEWCAGHDARDPALWYSERRERGAPEQYDADPQNASGRLFQELNVLLDALMDWYVILSICYADILGESGYVWTIRTKSRTRALISLGRFGREMQHLCLS